MPSAPSRMAFSKLARVFSGNVADACACRRVSGCATWSRRWQLTPRWPQHSGNDLADDMTKEGEKKEEADKDDRSRQRDGARGG